MVMVPVVYLVQFAYCSGTAYAAGATCMVGVRFAPRAAGTRYGAVVLTDSSSNVIATDLLEGVGTGPQAMFLPRRESKVAASGLNQPANLVVDGSGSLYFVDAGNGRVVKETNSAGGYTESTAFSGLVLTGKEKSNRHEVFYFAEGTLGAVRIDDWKYRLIDQPDGWTGPTVKLDWPVLSNLRLDPFERFLFQKGNTGTFNYVPDFYVHEFWRFVFLQQKIGEFAPSFIEFPPMQKGASFNLNSVKAEIQERMKAMKSKME